MEMLSKYIAVEIMALCLIVGFIIKKWVRDVDNKWIPTIVTILGVAAAVATNMGSIAWDAATLDIIVGGAVSGLASTGLHQMFTQWIDNGGK